MLFGGKEKAPKPGKILKSLRRNEIAITAQKAEGVTPLCQSRFGGKPAVPKNFVWPRFEAENYDGETANRPLSFLCQLSLSDIAAYDKEDLLPKTGLLLFFYEQESMCWGFDPADAGCARVYWFEDTEILGETDFPDDLKAEYRVREYALSFHAGDSYPGFEELECHVDIKCDWDAYEAVMEQSGYAPDCGRHKLLGYANLIQGEMLTECERGSRGLYSGDAKSYRETPEAVKADIQKSAKEWLLLFQMASIQEDDGELMFGDLGNLYFYLRREDLKDRRFDKAWLVSQCY